MTRPADKFPLRTVTEIMLNNREKVAALKKIKTPELASMAFLSVETTSDTTSKIQARYKLPCRSMQKVIYVSCKINMFDLQIC